MPPVYDIPACAIEVETIVKRSRFIACIQHVASREEAAAFITQTREKYPDASHHCSAFVAGSPDDVHVYGFDDDGEPSGTAGKPMLNVLSHKRIGEIVVVVTRYFGGIKLGAGGLVRAYSGAVQAACDQLLLKERIIMNHGCLACSYAQEQGVRHLLDINQALIEKSLYTDEVVLEISIPEAESKVLGQALSDFSRGVVSVIWRLEN